MGKKNIWIFLIAIVLFTSLVQAQELGTMRQGDCVNIVRSCENCTESNITSITSPLNESFLINGNFAMQQNVQQWNYTFCDTQILGVYTVYGFVEEPTPPNTRPWTLDFRVTKTGDIASTSEALIYGFLFFLNLCLFGLFLFIFISLPYENKKNEKGNVVGINKLKYVKLVVGWLGYGVFLWMISLMTGVSRNYIQQEYLGAWITGTFTYLYALGLGVSALVLWLIFWNFLKDIVLRSQLLKYGEVMSRKL